MDTIKLQEPAIVKPVAPHSTTTDKTSVAEPRTTAEEDRHSGGKRRINLLWEGVQAVLAISIVFTALGCTVWLLINDTENRITVFTFLVGTVGTVIGFYFGRTNHERVGGMDSR